MNCISKPQEKELFNLYKEFLNEFSFQGFNNIQKKSKRIYLPESGNGNTRYSNPTSLSFTIKSIIEPSIMTGFLKWEIRKFISTKPLFDFINQNNFYSFKFDSFEKDYGGYPSIVENFIAGIITRIYEINNFQFIITEESFRQAFDELIVFINSEIISIKFLANIIGPIGEIDEIILNNNIRILKADYIISNLFCTHYANSDINTFNQVEMYENDYYIEYTHSTKKNDFASVNVVPKNIDKIFRLISLASTGTISKGKIIREGDAWPFTGNGPWSVNYLHNNIKYTDNKFFYEFNNKNIEKLKCFFNDIGLKGISNLESGVEKSLQRFIKSKATFEIEEKLIELILAIEYLINTQPFEVTLQLCLKMIKLYSDSNDDENIYGNLKKFFALRGNIFHGRCDVELNKQNIELITFTEEVLLKIFERIFIDFNGFSLKKINSASEKSLYLNKKIIEILNEKYSEKIK